VTSIIIKVKYNNNKVKYANLASTRAVRTSHQSLANNSFLDSGTQLLLGFLNVKSLSEGVHFYAQRKEIFKGNNAVIPFDRVLINEGSGLDGSTGIFKAPKPGTYQFLFHGYKDNTQAAALNINLRVNGVHVANAYAQKYEKFGIPVGLHSVIKLKTGDEVSLIKYGEGWLHDDDSPDTHYSGWLVEEELII